MKNLHIIATEKPSLGKYLVFNKEGNLCIWETNTMGSQRRLLRQHIYITSDEKLPYDSTIFHTGAFYHIDFVGDVHIINKDTHYPNPNFCSRIILTTDESLFKYGVQAIDDEFLEWFVKNPSCKEVEVKLNSFGECHMGGDYCSCYDTADQSLCTLYYPNYKIIIPKEEHKCTCKEHDPYCCQIHGSCLTCVKKEEPKQETLEEVAIKYSKIFSLKGGHRNYAGQGFIDGAKWQQERMYSEAIEFAEWIRIKDFQTGSKDNWIGLDIKYYTTEELFEQFKKK